VIESKEKFFGVITQGMKDDKAPRSKKRELWWKGRLS